VRLVGYLKSNATQLQETRTQIFPRDKQKQGNKMDTSPFRSKFLIFHDQDLWVLNDDLVPNAEVTCRRRYSEDEALMEKQNTTSSRNIAYPARTETNYMQLQNNQ
jgi:hypothetical protein